ncbi:MAG: hypothetical protein AAFY99_03725 [Pseudomonadota bacterium]
MDPNEASNLGLETRAAYFQVIDGKTNMAPPAAAALWRKMESVELNNGDSVGVCIPFELPDIGDSLAVEQYLEIQRLIDRQEPAPRFSEKSVDNWVGVFVAEALKLDIAVGTPAPSEQELRTRIATEYARSSHI